MKSMYRLKDFVKKEFYLLISREGSSLIIEPSNTLYLRVPAEIKKEMKRRFGIDFDKNKNEICVRCDLATDQDGKVNLIYSFWCIESSKKQEEVVK